MGEKAELSLGLADAHSEEDQGEQEDQLAAAVAAPAQSLEVRELELKLQLRRLELDIEAKEREQIGKHELEREKICLVHERELHEIQLRAGADKSTPSSVSKFDVSRNIKFVPAFSEKDIENYILHFERVATTLEWPKHSWTLLLQCVLAGKAQEVYASLTLEQSAYYDIVKAAILRAYELVPEAYRQHVRNYSKGEKQTFVEFGREKEILFDRWCASQKVETKEDLQQLILLEELKNCVPEAVALYLSEQRVQNVNTAAVLADEYMLSLKISFNNKSNAGTRSHPPQRPCFANKVFDSYLAPCASSSKASASAKSSSSDRVCCYCKRPGHMIADCPILTTKQKSNPVALIGSVSCQFPPVSTEQE